uniref:Gag protein n=1 Tax=Rhinella marina endogenous retrovirus TaxID=2218595 RepID=A0A2U9K508_9RETR|nr:gag protein [Rhinella marina endogenous retrovirus]
MLRFLKQKKSVPHKLPEGAVAVRVLVESREGKKVVKNVEKLYKLVGLPSSGRLQPSVWQDLTVKEKGRLTDKGLFEHAQAHLRVARDLKKEGWKEVDGEGGSEDAEPVFGYKMPSNCDPIDCKMAAAPLMTNTQPQPPPYNGGNVRPPEVWVCPVCGVQNPPCVETCRECGAAHPWDSAHVTDGSGARLTSSGGHLGVPGSPPQPLYPLVTSSGEYYQGQPLPEKPPAPADVVSASAASVSALASGPSLPVQPTVIFVNTPTQAQGGAMPDIQALISSPAFQNAIRMRRQDMGLAGSHDGDDSPPMPSGVILDAPPPPPAPIQAPQPTSVPKPPLPVKPQHLQGQTPQEPEIWYPCYSRYYTMPQGFQVLFSVGYGDITTHRVGAIVNPANSTLAHRAGVARQIADKGGPAIEQECQAYLAQYGPMQPGQVMVTGGGNLPCDRILHAVGPIYDHRTPEHCRTMLQTTLQTVLTFAGQLGIGTLPRRTLAMPLISSGIFGYPLGPCMKDHVEVIKHCLQSVHNLDLQEVRIVCYYEAGMDSVMPLVAQHMVPLMHTGTRQESEPTPPEAPLPPPSVAPRDATEGRGEEGLQLKYMPFTPVQVDAIVTKLPDPDKHPMQYARKLEQIRQIYGATWADLSGITSIKASEYFLPTIMKELDPTKAGPLNQFKSGEEYMAQLMKWAQNRLSDQAGSIQDVQQEPGEAVEKYAARLTMQFEDLGYSTHVKTQAALLVRAFIDGLEDSLKDKVMKLRPELPDGPLQQALTVVKSYQRLLQREEKEAQKDKGKKKPAMYMAEASEVPIMVYQAQDRYGQPPSGPRRSRGQGYRTRPERDDQGRPLCWECGSPNHLRRDCPHRERGRGQGYDSQQRPPHPRS